MIVIVLVTLDTGNVQMFDGIERVAENVYAQIYTLPTLCIGSIANDDFVFPLSIHLQQLNFTARISLFLALSLPSR